MCDSVLDQELDFTMDIKVRDNLTDRELPDDIGTQMVFMSQREGRPDHFSWRVLHTNFLQRDTLLKSGRDGLPPPTKTYITSKHMRQAAEVCTFLS